MRLLLTAALALPIAASAQTPSSTLSWTPGVGGVPPTEFRIERKPVACGAAGTWARIGVVPAGTLAYTDTAVTLGNAYCYRVRAADAINESPPSNEAGKSFIPPTAPGSLIVK